MRVVHSLSTQSCDHKIHSEQPAQVACKYSGSSRSIMLYHFCLNRLILISLHAGGHATSAHTYVHCCYSGCLPTLKLSILTGSLRIWIRYSDIHTQKMDCISWKQRLYGKMPSSNTASSITYSPIIGHRCCWIEPVRGSWCYNRFLADLLLVPLKIWFREVSRIFFHKENAVEIDLNMLHIELTIWSVHCRRIPWTVVSLPCNFIYPVRTVIIVDFTHTVVF